MLKALIKQNGRIFIAVPNYQSFDSSVYRKYWAAYDVPRHLYHFSPKSMEILMKIHDLKIISKKPMWFDSFYISLISSKYRNGKTNWLSAIWNGLLSDIKTAANRDYCSSIVYIIAKN
jgi:hypothetical protein